MTHSSMPHVSNVASRASDEILCHNVHQLGNNLKNYSILVPNLADSKELHQLNLLWPCCKLPSAQPANMLATHSFIGSITPSSLR